MKDRPYPFYDLYLYLRHTLPEQLWRLRHRSCVRVLQRRPEFRPPDAARRVCATCRPRLDARR